MIGVSLLQGIFPTQGLNPPHIAGGFFYQLSHKGGPRLLEWIAYPFSKQIFQTQELSLALLHCRWILYQLSYQGSPKIFPDGTDCRESACNVEDPGSIPGSGRFPGEGNGNPLRYSYVENLMDGGAWQAIVHGVTKIQIQLSNFTSR